MRLYLVQHGDAVPKVRDPERPLSDKGLGDVKRLAAWLAKRDLKVGRILHSGKTRAKQTAELLAGKIASGTAIEAVAGIDPTDPIEPFMQLLDGWTDNVLVVGHLPFLAKLVSRLVCESARRPVVAYLPGSIVCLEKEADTGWVISWMARPELLG
ncbi:MAG: phosphohistidine phosphatase SixA [Gammaproteobacteria bacterium]|nr:phosphohistidine phosphatase SixA [Gammaproteobacteria bacterium]MCI0590027.1 phosphohistidine phosphatase SixA [Gammaproteobacteria bacterium]